ncbi:MAG TPA: hypothetical protein VES20_25085 [Bryobacteraceae bacterium]|nr:hypothetical protein [Bryobacteraceae bacterium]
MISRRQSLQALLVALGATRKGTGEGSAPPVRQITKGPGFHWFGYYDKLQFDSTSRYVLGMRVEFESRSPRADDVIHLGVVDTGDGDRWIPIGDTRAWNWQQGCMLQWVPGTKADIIWNDREGDGFVSRIMDFTTRKTRTIPAPIYSISPDGKSAVAPDFRRLNDCRPGYGYTGIPDPNASVLTPENAGLWHIDLRTGKTKLMFTFADAAKIPYPKGYGPEAKHWFNHLLYSTDGSRFIFLHRWRASGVPLTSFSTRMFTIGADGKDPYILDPHGKTSHFIWRDPKHVLAWAWHPSHGDKFYLYSDKTQDVAAVGPDVMTVNGHCTYLPGDRFVLNDTYPDKERNQNVYLYEVATTRRIPLGSFHSPKEYTGEWRCDTHPRFSPDGRKVCIDSPHNGGRQMYLIDISSLVS